MKRTMTVACALTCMVFLCACAIGQDKKADMDGADRERPRGAVIVSEEAVDPDAGQEASTTVQMQGLMQGNLEGVGSGFLAHTIPEQDGEDYKLCIFSEDDETADYGKLMSEADYYSLEMADYIFPDVRKNNSSIGTFKEIYFFDLVMVGGDGTAGLAVVATYDVNGETCYDTRIYRWDGTGYSAEEKLMQEFNEKYCNAKAYPVEELYHLSSSTDDESGDSVNILQPFCEILFSML